VKHYEITSESVNVTPIIL